ncbi:hypothetical protein BDY24DRAFT_197114 [Mrakia frigida]|uniref:uncharacterized protein n=1 Tax=Mrakia frigida TaxID=29902 RepID=UPI003FCC2142
MPPLLAYPQGHMTDHRKKESVNGYFRSARGRLDLRLGFVGREDSLEEDAHAGSSSTVLASASSQDRIKVVAISYDRMKVEVISRTPATLPISLHLTSRSSITLVLPRSFRGPVHLLNASRSKLILSSQLQQAFTHISSEPPISFIGSLAGWSGASPTEEDNKSSSSNTDGVSAGGGGTGGLKEVRLDELWIDNQGSGSKIHITYVGEDEEERVAREVSGGVGDGSRKKRGGFWRALGGCCCSCSSDNYQN